MEHDNSKALVEPSLRLLAKISVFFSVMGFIATAAAHGVERWEALAHIGSAILWASCYLGVTKDN